MKKLLIILFITFTYNLISQCYTTISSEIIIIDKCYNSKTSEIVFVDKFRCVRFFTRTIDCKGKTLKFEPMTIDYFY